MKKDYMLFLVLFCSVLFVQGQNRNLNDDLVAYYNFDDGTATDISGNGHDGTIFGTVPMIDWTNGKYADFNGDYNNYIRVPHHADLNFSDDFSISLWANWSEISGAKVIIAKGRDIQSNYTIRYGGDNFLLCYDGVYGHWVSTSMSTTENTWHHIVGVADKTNHIMKLYIDNVLADSKYLPDFSITTTYPLVIGRHFTYASGGSAWPYPFLGKVDEIRIYNKTLTSDEIQQLYDLNNPNPSPSASSVPLSNWSIIFAILLIGTVIWFRWFK